MSETPDPLSPELEVFLAPERRRPDPPVDMQSAIFSRIGATLGWPGDPGPDGSDPSGGGADPSGGAPPAGHVGGGGHLVADAVVKGSLAKTLATLVVGGVLGSGVHEAYDRVTERRSEARKVVAAAPAVEAPAPPPVAPPVEAPTPTAAVPADKPAARPERAARVEPRERDRNLAAERTLIEQARTALAREKSAAALAALERHARDFPQGDLDEERESLLVQALVGLERFEQARKTGVRFHRRFPRSIFGAVVDEALEVDSVMDGDR